MPTKWLFGLLPCPLFHAHIVDHGRQAALVKMAIEIASFEDMPMAEEMLEGWMKDLDERKAWSELNFAGLEAMKEQLADLKKSWTALDENGMVYI